MVHNRVGCRPSNEAHRQINSPPTIPESAASSGDEKLVLTVCG